jgi:putative peptidoglycan lipid II flippase
MMGAALMLLMPALLPYFGGSVLNRIWSLTALVGTGMAVFFVTAYLVGAIDPDLLATLRRRSAKRDERDDDILEVQ